MKIIHENNLDYKTLYHNMVQGLADYAVENKLNAFVLGVSGGLDSTIVASIAQDAAKIVGIPLIGLSLPCNTNKQEENDSANLAGKMCSVYKIINIQTLYETASKFFEAKKPIKSLLTTPIAEGNIKARIRMETLYHYAGVLGGIVLDTDNLTEHYTGFWTKHGDEGDVNPIGGLWKHELYQLAEWLRDNKKEHADAFQHAIDITPTDGNGVSKSDLDQIAPGLTYAQVDEILECWLQIPFEKRRDTLDGKHEFKLYTDLYGKYGKAIVDGVAHRNLRTEYKRKHAPLVIDPFSGKIVD